MFTLRCALMFVAVVTLVEIVIILMMLNGYGSELEPFLALVLDPEDIRMIKDAGRIARELSSFNDDDDLPGGGGYGGDGASYGRRTQQQQQQPVADAISPEAQHALNEKFADSVMSFDYDTARDMLKYSSGVDVNYHGNGKGHLLFRLCSSGKGRKNGKESPEMLKMVELLLDQPNIDPNDDEMSWPPLKAAVANMNVQCAQLLLRHKDIVPQVTVVGLTCDLVPHILPEIALVLPKKDHVDECFMGHGRSLYENDEAVKKGMLHKAAVRARIRAAKGGGGGGSGGGARAGGAARTAGGGGRQQQFGGSGVVGTAAEQQQRKKNAAAAQQQQAERIQQQQSAQKKQQQPSSTYKAKKWNYVMDPAEFPSLWSAAFFFATGIEWERCKGAVRLLVLILGAHGLVVGGSCALYLSTMNQRQRAADADAAEVAAAAAAAEEQPAATEAAAAAAAAEEQPAATEAAAAAAAAHAESGDVAAPPASEQQEEAPPAPAAAAAQSGDDVENQQPVRGEAE